MESIVLHSDIARLVLGYFVNNNLKRAALTLCRTSPHLHQEFIALRQGLQPHNFLNGGLEDIILEHVKITSLVANALQKLPIDIRQRLQQLKLSERVNELFKLDKSTFTNSKESASTRNANINVSTQRKRRRGYGHSLPSDGDGHARSPSPSPPGRRNCKRRRLLDPHLYCSIGRNLRLSNDHLDDNASLDSSTTSDLSSENTDDALHFDGHGHGPKKNSTPRTATSEEVELKMPMPQTMPEITHAIMTNREFQTKLLNNINTALQSLAVHAPSAESVNSEAVLDGLVRNILEATEKEPSFDRIIQDVVGMDTPATESVPGSATATGAEVLPDIQPKEPPQTPMIIRTAVASANAAAVVNNNNDINVINGSNSNAIIQLNANNSIGTLIDPNFSISKLIVLNSNESAQKQQPSANLSFGSENLINFTDGGIALANAEVDTNASAGIGATGGGQVCVDATNGQLTFPMFLSNEGLLSHLPFLVNNEWLAQQLRSDAFINMDVSHIEIPLPEPITVAANQLPPNSIIINSAVKQPPTTAEESLSEPPSQLIAEQPKPVTANASMLERSSSKVSNTSAVPASLDSSRPVVERVTPQTSGIVNVKAFRSLSTPRKRTSHVRTLNFSPKGVTTVTNTPQSTRRLPQKTFNHQLHQRRTQLKALKEKQAEDKLQSEEKPEKPVIIKSVEILPSFGSRACGTAAAGTANAASTTAVPTADVSGNDSNGNIPPLFAMEESSNQTVIKAVAASKSKLITCAATIVTTPKRKQKHRGGTKASKHVISHSQATTEDGHKKQLAVEKGASSSLDDSKENQRAPSGAHQQKLHGEGSELLEDQEDLLIAWQRQMQCSSTDLEQRLREINAKRNMFQNKMRVRRNRSTSIKKKTATQGTLQTSKQKKLKSPSISVKKKREKPKQLQHLSGNNMENEFIIKITPSQNIKVSCQESKEYKKIKEEKQQMQVEEKVQPAAESQEQKKLDKLDDQQSKEEQLKELDQQPASELVKTEVKGKPPERALANMAMLLETPFKAVLSDGGVEVPPTPGPTFMDTPYAKLLPSTSFLFGSDTKSILDTPMLTAITPGVALATPFGHILGTPHSSGAKTDYSGGSSYYRPDEAEHTDTNAQCALPETSPRDLGEPLTLKQATTCFELHAERLPVEPTVLRRVRSFGSEAVDSAEGAAAISASGEPQLAEPPHYKLVAGLPDAVIEHCSSSSSGCSSTSSDSTSSSSSGSSSSSSNSSNNNSPASSAKSGQLAKAVAPARIIKLLELGNLSDISSTEDEEWLKVEPASGSLDAPPLDIDNEPAQLVSQDGEVRYPLRSWLTPSKDAAAAATNVASADRNTSGEMAPPETATASPDTLKPAQQQKTVEPISPQAKSIEQRMLDLAEVCERVKAKVKESTAPKARSKNTNKKLTTMRETAHVANPKPILGNKTASKKGQMAKSEKKPKDNQSDESVKSVVAGGSSKAAPKSKSDSSETPKVNVAKPEPSASNLDPALLKALNLSAKKQQHLRSGRAAVQIAAQPAPSTSAGLRRGRPKKSSYTEPSRCSMRRSSRLIDNKTPALEEKDEKPSRAAGNAKVTKKPAKKRAEARVETPAPPLATLSEAQTTRKSPEQGNKQPQKKSSPPPPTPPPPPTTANSDYDLDMCKSASHLANTFCFTYADSGSKPAQPVQSQPAAFFTNFQMRIMVDNEMHSVRITNPQLLHQSLPTGEDSANASSIRNIPKKRIRIRFSNGGGAASNGGSASQDKAAAEAKPMASSTPLATNAQSEEPDDNDLEVANINTSSKGNTSEEQQMEGQDDGVQIEDIESILSHLHGT